MKNPIKTIAVVITILMTMNVQAQQANAIMTKSVVLNASVDNVWEELRQLDKFGELFPNFIAEVWIDDYKVPKEGLVRKCTSPGQKKGTVSYSETISEFDDEKRFYSYAVSGVPAKDMVNMFKVVDLGYKKSMVVWNSTSWTFVENPHMTKEQFLGFLGSALDEAMAQFDKKFN
ncbi:SRPBCC family protein [Spongiimicrobium sp. 2-473A-2-J]|uniref:SRPBCC family protein n=1 Tax=Eudoraea algarum TaxID=3417568 RepID=UPI003D35F7CD